MSIDWNGQKARNAAHLDNPIVGDYWQEMFMPICRVKAVSKTHVTVETRGEDKLMTLPEFRKWLSYETRPGTWCDCCPKGEPTFVYAP